MKKGGLSMFLFHSLENVLGLVRFRVFVPKYVCNILINGLYPFINKSSLLNKENKMLIFKSIFHAVILCSPNLGEKCQMSFAKTTGFTKQTVEIDFQ